MKGLGTSVVGDAYILVFIKSGANFKQHLLRALIRHSKKVYIYESYKFALFCFVLPVTLKLFRKPALTRLST
jgi:hypothetical protein